MHNTTQNQEYMVKNFNDISAKVIADNALLRLGIYILAIGYLEKRVPHFTKVIEDDKETNEKAKTISNLEEEIKIKQVFYKEKKNI